MKGKLNLLLLFLLIFPIIKLLPEDHPDITHLFNRVSSSIPVKTLSSPRTFHLPLKTSPPEPTDADLSETLEVQFTPLLRQTAQELGPDPVKIYQYVKNNFTYRPYFGSLKGAERTYLEGEGNDLDLTTLLITLLRINGIPARYAWGEIEISMEKIKSWMGIEKGEEAEKLFLKNGIPCQTIIEGGKITALRIPHFYVKAYINYYPSRGAKGIEPKRWIALDPSFSFHTFQEGENLPHEIGLDPQTFLEEIKRKSLGEEENSWITSLPSSYIEERMHEWGGRIKNYLFANQKELENAIPNLEKREEKAEYLPSSFPYHLLYEEGEASEIPDELRFKLTIEIGNLTQTFPLPILSTLTLYYEPESDIDREVIKEHGNEDQFPCYQVQVVPVLLKNSEEIARDESLPMGYPQDFILTLTSPTWEEKIYYRVKSGAFYHLLVNTGKISARYIEEQIEKIQNAKGGRDLLKELLHAIGLNYFYQRDSLIPLLSGSLKLYHSPQVSLLLTSYDFKVIHYEGTPYLATQPHLQLDLLKEIYTPASWEDEENSPIFLLIQSLTSSVLEELSLKRLPLRKPSPPPAYFTKPTLNPFPFTP